MDNDKEIKKYQALLDLYNSMHKMDLVLECQQKLKKLQNETL
jgi:hypothetical protein